MIWRDDDICESTLLADFEAVDRLFIEHKAIHTLAVITDGLVYNSKLVDYIRKHAHLSVQLHCHYHHDFTQLSADQVRFQFQEGIHIIHTLFDKAPTTWYPPWNRTNAEVNKIAAEYGLAPSWQKVSLEQYVSNFRPFDTINFHYWAPERMLLPAALEMTHEKM